MPFARIDTGFHRHPKAGAVGITGRALYISGLCFCAEQLTDGRIPKGSVPIVAAEAGVKPSVADALVEVGLWHDRGDHYAVNDYFDRGNPSRASVLQEREAARARAAKGRASRPNHRGSAPEPAQQFGRSSPARAPNEQANGRRSSSASHGLDLGLPGFTSSSSAVNGRADDDDEVTADDPRVEDALAILGQADYDQAVTDGLPIKNPPSYLRGCINGRRLSDLRPLIANAADHPDWTAQQLADHRLGRTPDGPAPPHCDRCGTLGHPTAACPDFPDLEAHP